MYGYLILFAWVLVEQLGIPLPAAPVLLTAGALSAEHELNFAFALLAGLAGSLIADSIPLHFPAPSTFPRKALAARSHEIPCDRDIVLYCTCPSEATAARTAMTLHKLGIERVRSLRGGYGEWKRLGYPVDPLRKPFFTLPDRP